jgi:hypothetical protein
LLLDVKLRTHCGGFLQIGSHNEVEFIHRTASDYLKKKDVWDGVLSHTNGEGSATGFDAHLALLIACVVSFKRDLVKDSRSVEIVQAHFYEAARYGKSVCPHNLHAQILLLDEFDRAAMVAYRSAKPTKDEISEFDPSTHWSALLFPVHWKTTFLSIASHETVNSYVEMKLSTNPRLLEHGTGLPLLGFSFLSNARSHYSVLSKILDLLEILLAQGADPNEKYEGVTMWQYWVHYIHWGTLDGQSRVKMLPALKRIFRSILNHDVDLHVCCIMDSQIWENVYPKQETRENRGFRSLRRQLIDHSKGEDELGDVSLESFFEEDHSLSAVITDIFNTEQDPHGADELLEHIAMLKHQKESSSHGGASAGHKKKRKRNKKKGKNSGA